MAFTEEPGGPAGAVVDALAEFRLRHADHGADERARRVVFATIAAGVAHILDAALVEVGEFVLFLLGPEPEFVDEVERVAHRIAGGELVGDLSENLADLVFDGVGRLGAGLKPFQVGEQLTIDELDEIRPRERGVVIVGAVGLLRRGPCGPAMRLIENELVGVADKLGLLSLLALQVVEVFEEQEPGGLLGVVEFRRAPGLFPKHVIEILESLFKHLVQSCYEIGSPTFQPESLWAGDFVARIFHRCLSGHGEGHKDASGNRDSISSRKKVTDTELGLTTLPELGIFFASFKELSHEESSFKN